MFNRFQRVPFSFSNSGRHGGKSKRERERRSHKQLCIPKNFSHLKSMILTNPDGESYRFLVEDVVLLVIQRDHGIIFFRGCHQHIYVTAEQLALVQEALDRL